MPALILPDPKAPTFDRARLTPEGFVRDPKGDVLIIPGDLPYDDVPEWAAFVREYNLPLGRAVIRARLKDGYSVFTQFDKDGIWWGPRSVGQQAPSIRLARFHAFQALAQRVLEDDPTNEYAAGTLVLAGRAIDRGDRPTTPVEYMTDMCLMTAAMNTAEAAKPPAEKAPEVAPWPPGDTRLFDRWFAGHPNRGVAAYKDSGEFKNLSAYAYTDKWGVYVGNDVPNIEGNEGSYEKNLIAAEKAYQRQLPRRHTAVLVSGGGNIEAQIVQVGGKRPVGEWYAWIHDTSRRFKVYSDNADELYARADRDGWWVISDHKTLAKGNAGGIEANTRAAERLYQHYAAKKDAEKKAAQAAEPKPPEVRHVTNPSEYPVNEWYTRVGPGNAFASRYEFGCPAFEDRRGLGADVSRAFWNLLDDGKIITSGDEGSYEKNLIAADKAYRNLLAAKAVKAPPPAPAAENGHVWKYENTVTCDGPRWAYTCNYCHVLHGSVLAGRPCAFAPKAAPAKDRYEIRRPTGDPYTTPTHIAIGQVWRDTHGSVATVSAVTTYKENFGDGRGGRLWDLVYDKDGRITDYGGCTYVGYVPVVWLDKVPSGG